MKNNKMWKKLLSLCLAGLFLLPMANFANTKTSVPSFSSESVKSKDLLLTEYSKLAEKFAISCNDLDKTNRPSGEKMKQCLTIAKDLRDKFSEFLKRLDLTVGKIRKGNKWNKDLDLNFPEFAKKQGIDLSTISEINQANGIRAYYQKSIQQLESSKSLIDAEIKELESQIKENASSQNQFFQQVSYSSTNNVRFLRVLKTVAKVAYKVAVAIIAACELSGGFCD